MLRKLITLLSLVLTLGFAASASAVAQGTPAVDQSSPVVAEPELEGLETGYARMYLPDFGSMLEALGTPDADIPEIDDQGVFTIMTAILTFDNADHADNGINETADTFADPDDPDIRLTSEDVEDLGDRATLYTGEMDSEGDTLSVNVLLVREGEQILLVQILGGESEAGTTQARDIIEFMLDTKPTTDEVSFNPDGTSTGGAFDRMPTGEDTDLIGNLAPFIDMDMSEIPSELGG